MQWNLLVTRVVLTSILRNFQVSTETFTSYSHGREYICQHDAVIFKLTLPSEVSCAFKCQIRKGCNGFNFKEESCIGCKDSCDKNSSPGESSTGQCWKRKESSSSSSDCQAYIDKIDPLEGGVFKIKSANGTVHDVFCLRHWDVDIVWTVFLRRVNGSLAFNRTFVDYKRGFGDVYGDHWKGLEFLHEMTTEKSTDLLFLIVGRGSRSETSTRTVRDVYANFSIGPGPAYRLSIGELSSGESMGIEPGYCFTYSNNSNFSTMDRDLSGSSCSSKQGYGGWWWNHDCLSLSPIGSYMEPGGRVTERCEGYELVKELTMAFRTKI